MQDIKIVLEDGQVFPCRSFGLKENVIGDFIFNTSLVGYQEALTDPSYHQEVLVMTFPLQGIYGINDLDAESKDSSPLAFVVQGFEKNFSNNHATQSLDDYMKKRKIVGAYDVDTRHLTKIIRDNGSMKGAIVDILLSDADVLSMIKAKKLNNHVLAVSPKKTEIINNGCSKKLVFLDFGAKDNILKNIISRNYTIIRMPYDATSEEIITHQPNFVFLSNGPGDPSELVASIATIKDLLKKGIKICGICLGHQLIAHALGGKTYRLKYGHHSINHPVQNVETGKVYLTSQNHNYSVEASSLPKDLKVFMKSLHDGTIEGLKSSSSKVISVQFHPEAAPGPNDANEIFDLFFSFLGGD